MSDIPFPVVRLASSFPALLVLIGATALTLTRMPHDPRRRAKVLAAIGILFVSQFRSFLTPLLLNIGPVDSIVMRIIMDGLMHSVAASIGYALLFWVILEVRPPRRPEQILGN
jgi:hypothetical protein